MPGLIVAFLCLVWLMPLGGLLFSPGCRIWRSENLEGKKEGKTFSHGVIYTKRIRNNIKNYKKISEYKIYVYT